MFACIVYELTPKFEENIRQGVIEKVKQLRLHALFGLWCGKLGIYLIPVQNFLLSGLFQYTFICLSDSTGECGQIWGDISKGTVAVT